MRFFSAVRNKLNNLTESERIITAVFLGTLGGEFMATRYAIQSKARIDEAERKINEKRAASSLQASRH